ncbi:Calx-beta domain-containing protein [Marinoscillum sp.]|uniref:Calx-beta domain-containing protein n=1 Tax=Marinoscillum sp. TaxID=2024838 RepID=UPI003BA9064D
MKHITKILSPLVLLVFLTGCFDDPGTDTLLTDEFVSFNVTSLQIGEADGNGSIVVDISQAQSSEVTVSFDMETSNAVEGVDFSLSATSVTIPAGEYSASIPFTVVDNNAFEPQARTFTLTLTDASGGVRVTANTSVTVGILNDDCPSNTSVWYGDVSVEDVGYGSNLGTGRANDSGDCDILVVFGDYVGASADVVWEFTPSAPGATSGTVIAAKQSYDCCTANYEYEAAGTYDEATGVITADYLFYQDGTVIFPGTTVITAN